jgi:hypothetical protein
MARKEGVYQQRLSSTSAVLNVGNFADLCFRRLPRRSEYEKRRESGLPDETALLLILGSCGKKPLTAEIARTTAEHAKKIFFASLAVLCHLCG